MSGATAARHRWRAAVLAVAVPAPACGADGPQQADRDAAPVTTTPGPAATGPGAPSGAETPGGVEPSGPAGPTEAPAPLSPLAALTAPAGSTETLPAPDPATPTVLRYPGIDVDSGPVVPVGVEADGAMEIPGASEIGWYRYGPSPGAAGSAVLAAHVAFDGRDGVFRRLTRAAPGDRFEVGFADGSTRAFEVVAVDQHAKVELPTTELFNREGPARLVLITCGGEFDADQRSYRDNVVVHAVALHEPIAATGG